MAEPRTRRRGSAALVLVLAAAMGVLSGASTRSDTAEGLRFDDPAALLRAALEARDDDMPARAEWLLTELSMRHAIIADHADRLRARLLLDTRQPGQAVGVLLEALKRHRTSPLRVDFYELLGDARSGFGDGEAARSAWHSALEATDDSERQASLWRDTAESLAADDKSEEAAAIWLKLWTDYPTREASEPADARLDELEKALGRSLRDGAAWRRRGERLFRRRHNEAALAAFDRALAEELSDRERARAGNQRAHTLFRLRRYDEAVRAFGALEQKDDVRLWYARSLARAGRVPESVTHFEKLAEESRSEIGVRARFLAALLLDGKGHGDRARKYFESVASARRYSGLAGAARWRLGWAAYRGGRWGEAVGYLEPLMANGRGDEIAGLRARYWRARALERQGAETAQAEFEALAREFPLTYYGWRARHRLEIQPKAEGGRPDDGKAALSSADLARPRILLEAGMVDEAIVELSRVRRRARGLDDRLALAELYTEAGEYNRAQRLMVDAYQEPLARGPIPGAEAAWWYAWPTAYAELVDRATSGPGSVPPQLVYSIMREESGYRPKVRSVSGARGLLQIMEPTALRLAAAVGRSDFATDQLFEPSVNIHLGTHYLGELSERFPGRLSAAIASYNAGPNAVGSWVASDGHRDDDEWVESIPYEQTRGYVRRVLRSLYAYRVLY
ncbi:MAG: transglycosylase SLT domain-containing protein [Myxococcota bacterium]